MKKKMGFNRVDTEYDSIKTIQAKIVHYGWVKAKKICVKTEVYLFPKEQ